MSGATDLIGLIDLSLGEKPSGVVNFNYLHCLLHEIVRRLDEQQQHIAPISSYIQNIDSSKVNLRASTATIPDNVPSDTSLPQGVAGTGLESTDTTPAHSSSIAIPGHSSSGQQHTGGSQPSSSSIPTGGDQHSLGMGTSAGLPSTVQPGSQSSSIQPGGQPSSIPAGSSVQTTSGQPHSTSTVNQTSSDNVTTGGVSRTPSVSQGGQPSTIQSGGQDLSNSSISSQPSAVKQHSSSHIVPSTSDDDRDGRSSSDIHGRPSSNADIHRPYSRVNRHRSSVVSAANDLGFLERKLQELEARVNTMETIPELLERKGSDSTATPVRDMWNFTSLNNRVGSVENGIDKVR